MNCLKNLKLLSIGLFLLYGFWVDPVLAVDGGVSFKVNILERKSTDTINDFDFSGLSANVLPQVLGASTDKNANFCRKSELEASKNIWQKLTNIFSMLK